MAGSLSDPGSTTPDVPRAHEGAHYANPTSKQVEVPVSKADQTGTQRVVWRLFFVLVLCVVVLVVAMGLVTRHL